MDDINDGTIAGVNDKYEYDYDETSVEESESSEENKCDEEENGDFDCECHFYREWELDTDTFSRVKYDEMIEKFGIGKRLIWRDEEDDESEKSYYILINPDDNKKVHVPKSVHEDICDTCMGYSLRRWKKEMFNHIDSATFITAIAYRGIIIPYREIFAKGMIWLKWRLDGIIDEYVIRGFVVACRAFDAPFNSGAFDTYDMPFEEVIFIDSVPAYKTLTHNKNLKLSKYSEVCVELQEQSASNANVERIIKYYSQYFRDDVSAKQLATIHKEIYLR
eukprot:209563_1